MMEIYPKPPSIVPAYSPDVPLPSEADQIESLSGNVATNQTNLTILQKKLDNHGGYNLFEGLRSFRNALADVDNNPIRIACVGDSVTFGAFSSDILNNNWVGRLRAILQNKFGNVGIGTYPIPHTTLTNAPWTLTGSWSINSVNGVFGRWMQASGTSNTATVTFTGTSCDLVYSTNASGASSGVSITIDGSPVTAPSFNSASLLWGNITTYTGLSAGSHTMVITAPSGGNIYIEGLIVYNPIASGAKGCYVLNMGTPSAMSGTQSAIASNIANVGKAHLYIVAFGINDAKNGSTYFNSYYSNMSTLISTFQNAGASVLLLPYYMINDSTQNNANYIQLIQQQYQLCDQFNCGLVDIYARWGKSWTLAQASGLMGDGGYDGNSGSDPWHPSNKGHRAIAQDIALNLVGSI